MARKKLDYNDLDKPAWIIFSVSLYQTRNPTDENSITICHCAVLCCAVPPFAPDGALEMSE